MINSFFYYCKSRHCTALTEKGKTFFPNKKEGKWMFIVSGNDYANKIVASRCVIINGKPATEVKFFNKENKLLVLDFVNEYKDYFEKTDQDILILKGIDFNKKETFAEIESLIKEWKTQISTT